ncbi:MAG: aldehyde dehydrogenase [Syntrophomonadaceae bacterium]|nr:aldehyde dehydrogenase [Syntrophomonadaceae bacterium]
MNKVMEFQHFIDGRWTPGNSGEHMEVINPCNQEVVAIVPKGNKEDVDRAVASAKAAFKSGVWAGKSKEERSKILLNVSRYLAANRKKLAELESLTSGRLIRVTNGVDVGGVINSLQFCAKALLTMPAVEYLECMPWFIPMHSYIVREPIGVCAGITPWNFPLLMAGWKIAPALAMGNSIVIKPASNTPASTLALAKLMNEAGIPDGVFNVVSGPGASIGSYLASHPDVDKIAFTGSTEVGRTIAHLAADGIKRVTLELGGKSPIIILDDADLDLASSMATWAFLMSAGQACESGTRVFVPRRLQEPLAELMVNKIKKMVIGDQMDRNTDLGPLISAQQLQTVMKYVEIGKKEGAELIYGGNRLTEGMFGKGFFHEPTIFVNCHNQMQQVREEIFGPVQCIIPYDDEDEAIEMANDSIYGLGGGVCSTNTNRAQEIASKLRTGTVWINTYHMLRADAPFGGYKQSGFGRENGYHAMLAYCEVKHICQNMDPDAKSHALFKGIGL